MPTYDSFLRSWRTNALEVDGEHGLLGYLGKVTDHRKPRGVRHDLRRSWR